MMVVPVQFIPGEYAVYVILGRDNLDRIEEYDPAVVPIKDLPASYHGLRLAEVVITFATEPELQRVMELAHQGKPREALKLVTRGFRFRPDLGDYEGPPLNVNSWKGRNEAVNRDEHLAWAKQRALEYLDAGELTNAFASMGSDLSKHPELAEIGRVMCQVGVIYVLNRNARELRHWIEGFN